MKQMLFALLMLPLLSVAQEVKKSDFQGVEMSDCLKYGIKELTKGDAGEMKGATAGRVTAETKTIYISRQPWLKNMPESHNGISFKYVDIDSAKKMIAEDVENNHAAVFYFSQFELRTNICEIWVFPIDVKKIRKKKYTQEYSTTGYKMSFAFMYDPPQYEYKGTDAVLLD